MDTVRSMRVFATVAQTGSFAAAADRLDLSRAAVTRHVAALEKHLGTRLLQRTTRRLALTDAGSLYRERCDRLLEWLDETEALVGRGQQTARGNLRVSAPVAFGSRHLAPALAAFLGQYPEITVDLALNDRRVSLVDEGFDVAIRIAERLEPGLVARRLSTSQLHLCAAPSYLARRGWPADPAALTSHDCLLYTYAPQATWRFRGAGQSYRVPVSGSLKANNGEALLAAAEAGLGLILQPDFIVQDAMAAGRLVPALPGFDPGRVGIHAVYASRDYLPFRVRLFMDFLAQRLAATELA